MCHNEAGLGSAISLEQLPSALKPEGWLRFFLKPLSATSLSSFSMASVAYCQTFIIYSLICTLFGYVPKLGAGARAGNKRDKVPFCVELTF